MRLSTFVSPSKFELNSKQNIHNDRHKFDLMNMAVERR